jgi:hypothetical protein
VVNNISKEEIELFYGVEGQGFFHAAPALVNGNDNFSKKMSPVKGNHGMGGLSVNK